VRTPDLRARWWHAGGEHAAEAGRFPTAEAYLDAFSTAAGVEVTREDWLSARRGDDATGRGPRRGRLAFRLGQVSLLTNNGALGSEHLTELARAGPAVR